MPGEVLKLNDMETSRFGVSCANFDGSASTMPDLDAINREAEEMKISMISTRVSADDIERVHALEGDGYKLMDALVYYSGRLSALKQTVDLPVDLELRKALPSDATAVESIASAAFENYFGHYHADPRLNNKTADEVYTDWALRSVEAAPERAPTFLIIENSQILGFATTRMNSCKEGEIVLSGVAPSAHGRGLYGRLISSCSSHLLKNGASQLLVATQVNNYAVQKVWSRAGLFHTRSCYTFHKWFD